MSDSISIRSLGSRVGETVRLLGWIRNHRSSGKIAFLIVRDGTGEVQVVVARHEVDEATWQTVTDRVAYECSVVVEGVVRADERSPSGVELTASRVEVLGDSSNDYPIQLKDAGVDFLLSKRHLWLRTTRQTAIMRIRDEVIKAIHDYFYDHDFVLVDTPILTGSIGESAGTLFETEYFDLGTAYLAQTGQLYVEAAAAALGKVYCFGPTFRAEKSKTRRHLTEFWMVEPEVAWLDSEGNMRLQEEFVTAIVGRVLERRLPELEVLERDTEPLRAVVPPFDRLSYTEAVEFLVSKGSEVTWGDDLGAEDEAILTEGRSKPLFVFDYPKSAKAFYMKENPEDPTTVKCNDLLAPEGYGEIIGGSQREDDLDKLTARIHEEGLPEEAYDWYLDLRRYGTFVHSGFGLGLERTVSWICGLPHLREAIAFPRMMSRLDP
ncbi:MAG: asparagine--tRNA ligase [marine benthic group bacterium]|jgi:asparaginyl-tRNA synthetase|nr:asparagine--tRNA ligase [Gemmatimonadota bacterium]MCL7937400.1 asparagine--tRNA ligase [Gemmatimonadota bacterium]MCL7956685.1 asparagine--tRNA ligase [Gemmatimonadota bacterium]MCL7966915.1 asparagine--tRNA ligase [Gemmatimonadota bacterium]MCL7970033.1 asparagine--tRNA ligase [Gemmatimonadota bacterium]